MNRLAVETSTYLRQHAENPVDWYPWGAEALSRARAEDKPILLSVGYAACHWCHVMEHESFSDEVTAQLMNERFVNIKVDREERPDVDTLYMQALVDLTGRGGWPMTVFLTPAGEPFYAGSYFPPTPRLGLPGFRDVLLEVSESFASQRAAVVGRASALAQQLRRSADTLDSGEPLERALLDDAVRTLARQFDPLNGGFGGAPKFPQASTLELLLHVHATTSEARPLRMATRALDKMAAGGIYDQLGGGFHRYSVDARWLVPHFEKMLYDNALLASVYLHGWLVTHQARYRTVAEETLDYLVRELRVAGAGFASSQDADVDGKEGHTYLWKPSEIREVLEPADAALVIERYGVTAHGNFEGSNVLHLASDAIADPVPLEWARRALLAARTERPQPPRDEKVVAAWNGLALTAFAEAALRLERDDYLEVARSLAEFLLEQMTSEDGRLRRVYRDGALTKHGYLDDYANVASGLLDLYAATGELRWIEESSRLAELAIDLFQDPAGPGFFLTPRDGEELVARTKDLDDLPTPAGNSVLAVCLLRLGRLYGNADFERRAVEVVRRARGRLQQMPAAVGRAACALDIHLSAPCEIVLVGPAEDPATAALRRVVFERYRPNAVVAFAEEPADSALERIPVLAGKGLVGGRPAAYVCERFACRAPVTEVEALRALLDDPVA